MARIAANPGASFDFPQEEVERLLSVLIEVVFNPAKPVAGTATYPADVARIKRRTSCVRSELRCSGQNPS